MKKLSLIIILLWLTAIITWVINLIKLLNCDFNPIDKHEIIHLIGLIPWVSIITAWY